jgi:hypothetical protein
VRTNCGDSHNHKVRIAGEALGLTGNECRCGSLSSWASVAGYHICGDEAHRPREAQPEIRFHSEDPLDPSRDQIQLANRRLRAIPDSVSESAVEC